jgi:hypothetical protein
MTQPEIRDLVVVFPGIIGSALEKDGEDLWAIIGSALWNTLITDPFPLSHAAVALDSGRWNLSPRHRRRTT